MGIKKSFAGAVALLAVSTLSHASDMPKGTIGIVCRDASGVMTDALEPAMKPAFEACVRAALIQLQAEKTDLDLSQYIPGFEDYKKIGTQLRVEYAFPVKAGN
jgi:hypothetical protein